MNRKGMGWGTILSITVLIAIIVITFGILTNTYAGWKLVKDDCKGTCRTSTACEAGETKISETCYKAGKKQEGVCCLSLDNLTSNSNSNSNGASNGNFNSNSNGDSNSNSNSNSNGASNSGGTTTTQGTPVIEIRKAQDDVTKIIGGTTQTLESGQTYNYRIWSAQQNPLYCTIKMLNSSNSELTQVQGMSLQITGAPCSDATNSNSNQQQIALTPQFFPGEQNVYKMIVMVHNSTGALVASTSLNFLILQTT